MVRKATSHAATSFTGQSSYASNARVVRIEHRDCGRLAVPVLRLDDVRGSEPPAVRVTNVRRVFHNGEHNAFTDLVRFRGQFYLTFRSCPDGHMVHPTASIIILSSPDAQSWEPVHQFRVEKRDTRDPHFLVFQQRLFVYTGTWYSGETTIAVADYDLNQHLGYAAWSEDGRTWHSPVMLEGTFGHYIWRAAACGDTAYLAGAARSALRSRPRGEGRQVESLMLESSDGLIWRKRAVFQEIDGDETAFLFEPDGTVLGIGRRGARRPSCCVAARPTQAGSARTLPQNVGGTAPDALGRPLRRGRTQVDGRSRPENRAVLAGRQPTPGICRIAQWRRQLVPRLCGLESHAGTCLLVLVARTG